MSELFHFDIETRTQYKTIDELEINDKKGFELFSKKYIKYEWINKHNNIEEAYVIEGGIIPTYGSICCISYGYINNIGDYAIQSIYGDDEKDIVNKFNEILKKVETKNFKLCGFRIMYFDIPWLLHKLHKYRIEPANIINVYDKKPWELRVVDMSDDWKFKYAYQFSFDEVCYELGIDSPKENMNGSEVTEKFWNGDIMDIKDYCEKDVKASIDVSKLIYNIKSL